MITLNQLLLLLMIAGIESNPGPPRQNLNISHVNINSITAPGRLDELHSFVELNNIDILMLTETKLDKNVHPSLYELPNFHPPFLNNRTRHGGGTATYIRTNISANRVTDLELDGEEWTWAIIKLNDSTILTCCLYLPPNLNADRLSDFLDRFTDSVTAAQSFSPTSILVLGDMNAGNIFLENQHTMHSGITSFDIKLKDTIETLNMTQLIREPTRINNNTANLRDLAITNNVHMIKEHGTLSAFSTIDHFPIYITLDISPSPTPLKSITVWDYARSDVNKLTQILINTDWDQILKEDIDTATQQFTNTILNAASEAIPTKTIHIRARDKPWMTNSLKQNIRKRDRLFKQAKRRQTTESWDEWRHQRNYVTSLNRHLRNRHIERETGNLLEHKHDPFNYHKTLRKIIGQQKQKSIPPLETTDGEMLTEESQKANLLNDYFASQTELTETPTLPDTVPSGGSVSTLNHIQVTEQEVLKLLNSLDIHKSTGPDLLPTKILKMTAILIYQPLTALLNKSLSNAKFPSSWKTANITPVFKNKGSASKPQNYRPISILCCMSKILEKIVFTRIYEHLTTNHLLSDKQSGYRPHHSTQMQLLHMTHDLYRALDQKQDFTTIYLDITKYFDKIWHAGLLYKCQKEFYITGTLLDWIKSYLADRRHKVKIDGVFSSMRTINAGCPQGSILGPLLAILYLNGLADKTENTSLFYADDISLYSSYFTQSMTSAQASLQRDLNLIESYGKQWAITFSATKTISQTFSNNHQHLSPSLTFAGREISSVDSHKHLGLHLSKDLRFHDHANEIIRKANIALSPLYPVASKLPRQVLENIYKTYIRPYFDYCDVVYDGHLTNYDERRLETLQNRAARLVTGTLFRTSTDKLRLELGWDRLIRRREIHKLTIFWQLKDNRTPIPDYIRHTLPQERLADTNRTLRNSTTTTLPGNRTTRFQKSFIPDTIRKWNKLPLSIRSQPSLKKFKSSLLKILGAKRPPKYYSLGSKQGNALHTQLRLGMSKLNSHLYQIQQTSSPHCSCGHKLESTLHFALHCPLYTQHRHNLFQDVSTELNTDFSRFTPTEQIETLLHGAHVSEASGRRVARLFQRYLLSTNRLT